MREEDDDDEDEEQDNVQELTAIQDGVSALHFMEANLNLVGDDPQLGQGSSHNFHSPKPPCGPKLSSKYDPAPWSDYFDTKELIDGKVPVYHAGSRGHVFLCLHGAGHSALSFAALAKIMKDEPYNSTVVAFDFRGHGDYYCEDETLLTQENLINETITAIKYVVGRYPN